MSQSGNIQYLHLCVRYDPPIIGIVYKNIKEDKKKIYTILLNSLVMKPNSMQAAQQLFLQHPHILKQTKITKEKIAQMILKIQNYLKEEQEYNDEQQGQGQGQQQQQAEQYQQQQYQHQQQQDHQQQQQQEQQYESKQAQPQVNKKKHKFDFDRDFGRDDGPLNRST